MPTDVQKAESVLRNALAKRLELMANGDSTEEADDALSSAQARWAETIQRLSLNAGRTGLVLQIASMARPFGCQPEDQLVHKPINSPEFNPCCVARIRRTGQNMSLTGEKP